MLFIMGWGTAVDYQAKTLVRELTATNASALERIVKSAFSELPARAHQLRQVSNIGRFDLGNFGVSLPKRFLEADKAAGRPMRGRRFPPTPPSRPTASSIDILHRACNRCTAKHRVTLNSPQIVRN